MKYRILGVIAGLITIVAAFMYRIFPCFSTTL